MKKITLIFVGIFFTLSSTQVFAANDKGFGNNLVKVISKNTENKRATLLIFNYENDKKITTAIEKLKAKLIINDVQLTDKNQTKQILNSLNIKRPIFNPLITRQMGILFKSEAIITLESKTDKINIVVYETKKGKVIFDETTPLKSIIGAPIAPMVAIVPALPKIEISTPTVKAEKPTIVVSTLTVKLPKITVVEVSTPTVKPIKVVTIVDSTPTVKVAPAVVKPVKPIVKKKPVKTDLELRLEKQLAALIKQTERLSEKLDKREEQITGIPRWTKHSLGFGGEVGAFTINSNGFTKGMEQYHDAKIYTDNFTTALKVFYERKLNDKYKLGLAVGFGNAGYETLDKYGSTFDLIPTSNFATIYIKKKLNNRWGLYGGLGLSSIDLELTDFIVFTGSVQHDSFSATKTAPHIEFGTDCVVKKVNLRFGIRYIFMAKIDSIEGTTQNGTERLIVINDNQLALKRTDLALASNEKAFEVDLGSLGIFLSMQFDLFKWGTK